MHLDAGVSGGTGAASTAARDEDVLAAQLEGASTAGVRNLVLLCPRTSLATLPDLATRWAAAARGCSLRLVATAPSATLCDVPKDWTYLDPPSEPLQSLRVGGDGDGDGGGELSDAAPPDGAAVRADALARLLLSLAAAEPDAAAAAGPLIQYVVPPPATPTSPPTLTLRGGSRGDVRRAGTVSMMGGRNGRRRSRSQPSQPPLERFDVRVPELGDAVIAITPCPGKRARDLGSDLDELKAWGAAAVVTLVQQSELTSLDVADMGAQAETRGMRWFHCPIPDFDGPGGAFEAAWGGGGAGDAVRSLLRGGGKVVVHCRGGIGRAGTITARLLIELGVAEPDEALRRVRSARPGAVETWEQEAHVMGVRPVAES